MKIRRKQCDAKLKAKVVMEAIKQHKTLNELAVKYEVSPVMISRQEKEFIENFWITIKYQYIYIQPDGNGAAQYSGIRDPLTTTNIIESIKESTAKYQTGFTFVRQLD